MKVVCYVYLLTILLTSCRVDDVEIDLYSGSRDWARLAIPEGREAYSVVGNINDTLLATTWTKAFYTTDGGKNWTLSKDFNGHVYLNERNDTIFALIGTPYTENFEYKYASICQYLTTNYGKSWFRDSTGHYSHMRKIIGIDTSSTGIVYKIKDNFTPISPNSATYYINPSSLEKQEASHWEALDLSMSLKLYDVYLDKNDYLYLTASSGYFTKENNALFCCYTDQPGLIYISKSKLP